ncbi:MAG TPA: hypothetical protein VJW20_12890 [Candidatus Angelobacter sp.]|nr:hypothetical protein [Candidatus Angelobacter sp.]
MSRSKPRKTRVLVEKPAPVNPPLDPLRAGMPAQDSITGVSKLPKGKYRVIHTDEVDEYEKPPGSKSKKR